ncbi:MAG TPA: GAF and ANTAR domain-containing protein [Acidimicrobiales bacterium]|nr:GAF and ANTAR domain-containing protein [Acidimicrobiales bacterium]
MNREALVAQTFVSLTDTLVDDFDIVEVHSVLVERCVELFELTAAAVMLAGPDGDPRVGASSSEAMHLLEVFELQSQEGPCLDCIRSGEPVVNEDLEHVNGRWPTFVPAALAAGFRSVHALPMRLRGTTLGALNMYKSDAEPLSTEEVLLAQALADVATIAVMQHQAARDAQVLNEQLTHALHSRITIEQAKGIVAERGHQDMEQAFQRLRSYARRNNLKLADVAQRVIDGTLVVEALE